MTNASCLCISMLKSGKIKPDAITDEALYFEAILTGRIELVTYNELSIIICS